MWPPSAHLHYILYFLRSSVFWLSSSNLHIHSPVSHLLFPVSCLLSSLFCFPSYKLSRRWDMYMQFKLQMCYFVLAVLQSQNWQFKWNGSLPYTFKCVTSWSVKFVRYIYLSRKILNARNTIINKRKSKFSMCTCLKRFFRSSVPLMFAYFHILKTLPK